MDESALLDTITKHVESTVGPVADVWHEIVSGDMHLDILRVAPAEDRPFHTLVTCGMSARPMSVPAGYEEYRLAELCLLLPPDWPLSEADLKDETNYWPIRLLKTACSFPFEHETWLGYMHTLQNGVGDPPPPYADDVAFCAAILLPSLTLGPAFLQCQPAEGQSVNFWCLYPLNWDEFKFKLKKGGDKLLGRFDRAGMTDVVAKQRASAVKR